jgi:hypothetical protein
MLTQFEIESDENGKFLPTIKNQITGANHESIFFREEDIPENIQMDTRSPYKIYPGNAFHINIAASPCLIDPDIPLRYSLQNAFDGDPATSYVENTESDLMDIYFSSPVEEISIINGFAQNEFLYGANNRIQKIISGSTLRHENQRYAVFTELSIIELQDNFLNYQIGKTNNSYTIKVVNIYGGSMYNDTCIAELNVKTANGWIFGSMGNE